MTRNYRHRQQEMAMAEGFFKMACAGSVIRVVHLAPVARRMHEIKPLVKDGEPPSFIVVSPEADAEIRQMTPAFASNPNGTIDTRDEMIQVGQVYRLLEKSAPETFVYCQKMMAVMNQCAPRLTLRSPTQEQSRACFAKNVGPIVEGLLAHLRRNIPLASSPR